MIMTFQLRYGCLWSPVLFAQMHLPVELVTVEHFANEAIYYKVLIGQVDSDRFDKMVIQSLDTVKIRLGTIIVYGSSKDQTTLSKGILDHCEFTTSSRRIAKLQAPEGCPEIQEATKLGGSIVVRRLGKDCHKTTKILRGSSNTLHIQSMETDYDVLLVRYSRPLGKQNEARITPHFFVRAKENVTKENVTVDAASILSERITKLISSRFITLSLRSDAWFLTDCSFPTFYPYEDLPPIPKEREYYQLKEISCSGSNYFPMRCIPAALFP